MLREGLLMTRSMEATNTATMEPILKMYLPSFEAQLVGLLQLEDSDPSA